MKAESKRFYQSLMALVLPITLQNFITNAVNSADVFMLGYVGQTELSAVSLANQFQFLLSGVFFGISSAVVMLASQYWGKKDTDSIQAVMGIAVKIAFVITGLLAIGSVCMPETLMRIYTDNEMLISIGTSYLRIVGMSYVCMSFSQVYLCALRSMERAQISTAISAVALLSNIVLNAVFIFGIGGAPKLGVIGVAVGTTTARVLELLLCLADAVRGKIFRINLKIMFGKHKMLFADFCKYSIPALINDFAWTLAFSMYSVIMGHMNADVVAANSVVSTVRNLCMIMGFALGSGASVLLGIEIGEGRIEDARRDARKSCYVTLVVGIATGILILLLRPLVFMCFSLTDRAEGYLNIMLWISSYYVVGQAMNTLLISGVFRAGGDSKFGMICDIIVMWGISVPLGFLCAFVWNLPPMAVYFILCLDEFWKIPAVYAHYKKFGWLKDITREYE
ncbi:MAG: MATE family efflux transporter [Lachnospiraceae bacterium]|nr:MATE family efflux transporter [Lachnospiraceae bacterium]